MANSRSRQTKTFLTQYIGNMTYLIIRFTTLGNVAMTVPVVASLSRRYPNDRFIIACKKDLASMFASMQDKLNANW